MIHTTQIIPVLPNVILFTMQPSDYDLPDGMSFIIWLLLAPNVRSLYLETRPNAEKLQWGKELLELIERHERLKPIINRLNRVTVFSYLEEIDETIKTELFNLFTKIFPKAIIGYL